jgi:hypothetical protein
MRERPMRELVEDELATLVRARLEARRPHRLPAHFVPRPRPSHRGRWVLVAMATVAGFALGLAVAATIRPDLGTAVESGLRSRLPGAAQPTPAGPPTSSPAGGTQQPGSSAAPGVQPSDGSAPGGRQSSSQPPGAAGGAGSGAQPAPGAAGGGSTPAPQPGLPGLPVPLPSAPPLPVSPPPLPVSTPSLP